jgi:hypothetical protein
MKSGEEFYFPKWIEEAPEENRPNLRARYLLRLAAALATPECTIRAMAAASGLNAGSLNSMLSSGSFDRGFPVNVIKGIESLIGVGVIPRTILNPEIYDGNH